MITNKDIRVENGNLVLNGDKFPLDGQSPEAIMEIVEDNSDTTPTENSTAPITSGGVFTALGTKQNTLTFDSAPTAESANPVTSGGVYTAIGNSIKTAEVNITSSTSGHSAPVASAGGVYYEALVNYETLGVTKNKILSVEIINWDGITTAFNLYLGGNTISAMSNSANSIYSSSGSFIDLRVVYRG